MIQRWVRYERMGERPFDWFNDGPDTYRWLKAYHPDLAPGFLKAAEIVGWGDWVAH